MSGRTRFSSVARESCGSDPGPLSPYLAPAARVPVFEDLRTAWVSREPSFLILGTQTSLLPTLFLPVFPSSLSFLACLCAQSEICKKAAVVRSVSSGSLCPLHTWDLRPQNPTSEPPWRGLRLIPVLLDMRIQRASQGLETCVLLKPSVDPLLQLRTISLEIMNEHNFRTVFSHGLMDPSFFLCPQSPHPLSFPCLVP